MNGRSLNNRAEGIMVVETRTLSKAFSNQPRFIPINRIIGVAFDTKYPLTTNQIVRRYKRNKISSMIRNKSIIFSMHGLKPLLVGKGNLNTNRFNSGGQRMLGNNKSEGSVVKPFWFINIIIGLGYHLMGSGRRRMWWCWWRW